MFLKSILVSLLVPPFGFVTLAVLALLLPRSRVTWENAKFSADILRKEGITSVYVVTHAWHMRRALLAFAPTGLTVTAAPTPPDKRDGAIFDDFMPRASTWNVSYFALHEWIGYAWYSFR